ncbi:MAG: bL21 family ribosomal protein, partial [Pseudomonadota bacterium]
MQPTYAIIRTGAKQYLVRPGDVIQVEKLDGAENEPVIFS